MLDSVKILNDSLAIADTLVRADTTQTGVGNVSPWMGVLFTVLIGVAIGLVYLTRK